MPAADRPARAPWGRFWLHAGPAFALAAVMILVLPLDRAGGTEPPLRLLFLLALTVGIVTLTALYLVVRRELGLPASVAVLALTFEGLVVVVKFVAGPAGLYEANRGHTFEQIASLNEGAGAVPAAALIFLLYAGVLLLVYRHARRRSGLFAKLPKAARTSRGLAVGLVVAAVLFAATVGTGVLLIVLVASEAGLEYVTDLFAGSAGLLVAVVLGIATAVATKVFRDVADRASALHNAAVLVAFFWTCLAFLALYHVLWVVYILVLTSVWPLKVVTPK